MRIVLALLALIGLGVVLLLPKNVAAAELVSLDTVQDVCLGTELSACKVATAGYATSSDDTHRIAWQTQTGYTLEDGILGGIVLLEPSGDGWSIFATAYDAAHYGTPRLIDTGLLHVPGVGLTDVSPTADLLFAHDTATADWAPIDITSWKQMVDPMTGIMLYKGVDYDFEAMTGRALFRVDKDAYGGPAHGTVVITFVLEDRTLAYQYQRIAD